MQGQQACDSLVERWARAVRATANNAGLIVGDDLEAAARAIAAAPFPEGASRDEAINELVAFSVSEAYFTVRRELGLTIDDEVAAPGREV